MYTSIINDGLAFIEGFALIVSPCILPILPIILAGGLSGGRKRPLGIMIGFTLFFALFTLLSSTIIRHIGVNFTWIQHISYLLIGLFGIVLIFDTLSFQFSRITQKLADKSGQYADKRYQDGLWSGVLFGALVSLIWVPCGGPILAAAIVSMAVQKTLWQSFITFLFFALGSVLPMVLIVLLGKKLMNKVTFFKRHGSILRKILGIIIVIMALLLSLNSNAITWLTGGNTASSTLKTDNHLIDALNIPYAAPPLNSDTVWLNSAPLTIDQLKGKVVLVDFWTYSCINCVRTLPYLRDWYQKYHNDGLVIIGVHAPEFEFEKSVANVKQAIQQYHITYPVVLDNHYIIWQNYQNAYWPAHYLINKQGQVVYQHFGEGDYSETEHNIQVLLGLNQVNKAKNPAEAQSALQQTPETYLGYERAQRYQGAPELNIDTNVSYQLPTALALNAWALQGLWSIHPQYIASLAANNRIQLHFVAQHVYMVMGKQGDKPVHADVWLNGKLVNRLVIDRQNLYPVLDLPSSQQGELTIHFAEPGVNVYTFTFG